MNIRNIIRETFNILSEEEYFSNKLSDDIKENSAEYIGRQVTWYGDPSQMIVVNKNQIEGMWGNIYDSDKMDFLTNLIKSSEENVELECSYAYGSVVNFQEIKEHQIANFNNRFEIDYDGIKEPYSIGDADLDEYIGNETYIPDENYTSLTEVDDFFIENKFSLIENTKSLEQLKKEFYDLERDSDGEDFKEEKDYNTFNEFIDIETKIKRAIENEDGDLGSFIVQLRDGHHRIMSAIAAGEDKVCVNLVKEDIEKYKGYYTKVNTSYTNENILKESNLEDFYKEQNINPEVLSFLGSGDFGNAYIIDDNRVLKITSSKSEFDLAKKLVNKNIPALKGFVDFYFADVIDGKYYIIMERLEEDYSIEDMFYQLEDLLSEQGLPIQYLDNLDTSELDLDEEMIKFIDDIDDINRAYRYLGIEASDIKPDNLGVDNEGKIKAFDIDDKSINENDLMKEVTENESFIVYHGSPHKIEKFTDEFVGAEEATDQEGPGIYFTTSHQEALGYANGGYVYEVRVSPKILFDESEEKDINRDLLVQLVKMSPRLEISTSNWSPDIETGIEMMVDSAYEYNDNEKEVLLQIWIEAYRYDSVDFVRNCVKLGIDGIIVNREGSKHIIIYNPNVIELREIEDVKKNQLSEIRKLVRKELQNVFSNNEKILTESSDPFSASNTRVPFNLDLMTQAITQGREVGILYKGDEMKAPSGKYRLIYPVAMGISRAGNRVIRAVHTIGQSESEAKSTNIRSAEAKNVWRLFKANNIRGMWFTGNFFNFNPDKYNPNDKGMNTVEVNFDLSKAKKYQDELIQKQKEEGDFKSKVRRFRESGARDLEQPYDNPETND